MQKYSISIRMSFLLSKKKKINNLFTDKVGRLQEKQKAK